jgi:diguanylate cyclase (GGDEF)-like protein
MSADRRTPRCDLPSWATVPTGLLSLGAVGLLDYWTGPEAGFSIFYVLPVAWVTWRGRGLLGLLAAVAGAAVWYLNESWAGVEHSHPAIAVWNAVVRLAFFVIAVYAVERTRRSLDRERSLSETDSLTGLANSRSFYAAAERELDRVRRHNAPTTIVYIDLDNFKRVNDTRGHLAGDDTLRAIAAAMRSSIRAVDVAARLGGDEFAILMPHTAEDGAHSAVERLRQAMLELTQVEATGVTLSIGVVTYREPPESTQDMVRRADRLMYAVKESGKDAVRCESVGGRSGTIDAEKIFRETVP